MSVEHRKLTRRNFLNCASGSVQGMMLYPLLKETSAFGSEIQNDKSTVVKVSDDSVVIDNAVDHATIQIMLDTAIQNLMGTNVTGDAWKSLFPGITKDSVISIKVNCINSSLSSHPEVAYSIVNGLTRMKFDDVFFPEENIIIWDRTNNELKSAGYSLNTGDTGVKCFGTNQSGVGYAATTYNVNGVTQRLSNILTDISDYVINLCVLKNHGTSGLTFSMKNHYGSCSSPGNLHGSYCNPYIPALNSLSPIRDKQVINICDAVWGIISGGPSGAPQIMPKTLVLSTDTVACDYICAQILEENGCKTISRAQHIAEAAKAPYNLGTDDPEKINLIELKNPTVNVKEEQTKDSTPYGFRLYQNYPNPFNSETTLSYQLFEPADVKMEIYNIQGALVDRLVYGTQSSGYYRVQWNGTSLNGSAVASGIYFSRFSVGNIRRNVRMQYVK
ncbi:MAG: DUF362 domain-containing protein [Candidatus Latescibacteria bacterium]|nr:DUF362 domain-containing protein [Candidatus Latescibacterota bacterium]